MLPCTGTAFICEGPACGTWAKFGGAAGGTTKPYWGALGVWLTEWKSVAVYGGGGSRCSDLPMLFIVFNQFDDYSVIK